MALDFNTGMVLQALLWWISGSLVGGVLWALIFPRLPVPPRPGLTDTEWIERR
jgi:hypothetical protein